MRRIALKVTVIHGNDRQGNTYKAVELFKAELARLGSIDYAEYFLPKDLPHFCNGCLACLVNGRERCPHSSHITPIVNDIFTSDGVILASPVYVMNVSGGMKSFLDHLFTMWIPHRPEVELFDKIGIAITTAAGTGMRPTLKTMTRSFNYLGFKRYFSFGCRALDLERAETKVKAKVAHKAHEFYQTMLKRKSLAPRLYPKLIFAAMRPMIRSYADDSVVARDKEYWLQKGWLDSKSPWK